MLKKSTSCSTNNRSFYTNSCLEWQPMCAYSYKPRVQMGLNTKLSFSIATPSYSTVIDRCWTHVHCVQKYHTWFLAQLPGLVIHDYSYIYCLKFSFKFINFCPGATQENHRNSVCPNSVQQTLRHSVGIITDMIWYTATIVLQYAINKYVFKCLVHLHQITDNTNEAMCILTRSQTRLLVCEKSLRLWSQQEIKWPTKKVKR